MLKYCPPICKAVVCSAYILVIDKIIKHSHHRSRWRSMLKRVELSCTTYHIITTSHFYVDFIPVSIFHANKPKVKRLIAIWSTSECVYLHNDIKPYEHLMNLPFYFLMKNQQGIFPKKLLKTGKIHRTKYVRRFTSRNIIFHCMFNLNVSCARI